MSNKQQLQLNNTNLASYTDRVDALIEVANSLPEAGGVTLPDLVSPAAADEIFLNKQTIDEDGNVLTGTFTIDSELATQDDLISQIETALSNKASVSLPSLSNPVTASDILSSKEAIDEDGNIITGTIQSQAAQTITPSTSDQTIAAGKYLAGAQTIKGDANLIADNIKSGVSIFGVSGAYESSGGNSADYSAEDGLIDGTTKVYSNNRVSSIQPYTFCSNFNLTSVDFAAVITIGSSAFVSCKSLTNVNFPACKTINTYAFYNCSALTTASFPTATLISGNAFRNCSKLTTLNIPMVGSIGANAFQYCSSLKSINLSNVSYIGGYAFASCRTLSTLVLGASSVCTLSASTAFTSTPYAGYSTYFSGTPYIYVPASLVDSYKTATNWTYFSNYISAYNE